MQGLDAMVAYGGSDPAKLARHGGTAVADRRAERFHHPLIVTWALVAGGATVTAMRSEGAERGG